MHNTWKGIKESTIDYILLNLTNEVNQVINSVKLSDDYPIVAKFKYQYKITKTRKTITIKKKEEKTSKYRRDKTDFIKWGLVNNISDKHR